MRLKKYLKGDGTANGEATLKAFKGGRKSIGRMAFLELAQVLTTSGKKLVNSVDYVRGVLVHDVVDVLQHIIDEHITSKQKKKDLTRMLKNASNFLKNQFKSHVIREDDCDTHGINHGLLAPVALKTTKHYSCLEKVQLDDLLLERGITAKGNSIVARIQALEAWDKKAKEHCDSASELTPAHSSSDESDALLDGLNERLNYMTLKQLREEIKSQNLQVKARKPQQLRDVLLEHYWRSNTPELTKEESSSEWDPGGTENDSEASIELLLEPDEQSEKDQVEVNECGEFGETDTSATCLGCAFIHKLMLEVLPQAVANERTNDDNDAIDNALVYIDDAHEKFMLYMGHQVRVVNQNKKLDEYDEALKNHCCQERNSQAICLSLIIDFKMKWEAMYQREKTIQNYGKRGISWHGIRGQYYIWDVEKHIRKRQKAGWSFYVVIFGTRIKLTWTIFLCELPLFLKHFTQIVALVRSSIFG
jgi:hypothetical protein